MSPIKDTWIKTESKNTNIQTPETNNYFGPFSNIFVCTFVHILYSHVHTHIYRHYENNCINDLWTYEFSKHNGSHCIFYFISNLFQFTLHLNIFHVTVQKWFKNLHVYILHDISFHEPITMSKHSLVSGQFSKMRTWEDLVQCLSSTYTTWV